MTWDKLKDCTRLAYYAVHRKQICEFVFNEHNYLKEGEQLVPIDDQLKTLVVNQGKKPRIPQLVSGDRQFLQIHSPAALSYSWGSKKQQMTFLEGRTLFQLVFKYQIFKSDLN